ncbi:MAG: aldehyde dehydrogenase family protein [Chloroflexia bacterium]|nr:aldehyde dehydrogenase family protein [Chloroflexia bacterium]
MTETYPMFLAGAWATSERPLEVRNPYNAEVIGTTFFASAEQLDHAIRAAESAFCELRRMPTFDRVALLKALAEKVRACREEMIRTVSLEAGKPVREAEIEVDRGAFTLDTAAEEAKRIEGDVIPLDLLASSKGRFGIVRRFPIGPIAGISPFNFPLNLALHKVAPALASGNPIVLKPPSACPLTMLLFARLMDEVGVPKGAVSVLPMDRETGDKLVSDERFKLLSFTGSPDVGWDMKRRAGMKPVVLELGGNAGVLIDDDADVDFAVSRIRVGAFAYAGQVCISVQRVFIHESIYDRVRDQIVETAKTLRMGDPLDPETELGPMIDAKAAGRSEQWVRDAVSGGARVLTGGQAKGRFFPPTVIENAAPGSFVCSREAFAPLVTLFPVKRFAEGIERLNDSVYGLQAGVFTNRLEHALYAFETVETGAVIINDVPTYRIDHMPYGGVKASGLSREGIRYAIEDMTEPRLMVVNRLESQAVS